jgi:hypothetical protein
MYSRRSTGYSYSYNMNVPGKQWWEREDVVAFTRNTDGSWDEIEVTGGTEPAFTSKPNFRWRFGALTFTKEADGLVFWGGFNNYSPTQGDDTYSSYYGYGNGAYCSYQDAGSLYAYDFDDEVVRLILDEDDGGHDDIGEEYDGDDPVGSSSWTGRYQGYGGVIVPMGVFLSENREFMYMLTRGAISTSNTLDQTQFQLIGVNIRSMDDSRSINGHDDGYAFRLDDWPERRGFLWQYYYYHYYGMGGQSSGSYDYYPPHKRGFVKMARDNGRVFWGGHYQTYGPYNYTSSYSYGGPTHPTWSSFYFPVAGELFMFDSNIGGVVNQLSTLGGTLASYSNSTSRMIKYINPTRDGTSVMYVYCGPKGSYSSQAVDYFNERLGYAGNIVTDSTGRVTSHDEVDSVVSSSGSVSSAISPSPLGSAVYYAFGTGTNERKQVYKAFPTDGSSVSTGGTARRYNVLKAYR